MAISVGKTATGNAYIDGLLVGTRWNGDFTYSFPQLASDYQAGNPETATFSPISQQQREAVRAILTGQTFFSATTNVMKATYVNSFISFTVSETANSGFNGLGDMRLAQSPLADPTAYAYFPSNAVNGRGGDVWFGDDYAGTISDYRNPFSGGYSFQTHIHELGHAMGLKHGHEGGGVSNTTLPADRDAVEFSVMSYRSFIGGPVDEGYSFGPNDGPQTFMQYDILALQTLYGPNFGQKSNNTDTTYMWSSTTGEMTINGARQGTPGGNKVFLTVWDGGGNDVYDMSNYATAVNIDLKPGGWSITSEAQRADLGFGHKANGTVYNSLLFGGQLNSIIENAVGGSGNDTISGNQLGNTLSGRDGNDTISGLDGGDSLFGENGNDSLKGGGGTDFLSGLENNDVLKGGGGADSLFGGNGFDTAAYSDAAGGITIDLALGTAAGDVAAGDALGSIEALAGSDHPDSFTGSGEANRLDGAGGADTLTGGLGRDTIIGGEGDDVVVTNAGDGPGERYNGGNGNDELLVQSSIAFIQSVLAGFESLEFSAAFATAKSVHLLAGQIGGGLSSTATIDGALIGQADTLRISMGNESSLDLSDLTFIEWDPGAAEGDTVIVVGGAAGDVVFGSDVADTINGNAGNDSLAGGLANDRLSGSIGNDTLGGGIGSDTLIGGLGNDLYIANDAADVFVELARGGTDTLRSAVSVAALAANIENLILAGSGPISGTGNELANRVTGNTGANTIQGAAGVDFLSGGGGSDTVNGGADNDRVNGGEGNDRLNGSTGKDTLSGGAGTDSFVFSTALNPATNVDRVVDFTGSDLLLLENSIFTGIGATLDSGEFRVGAAAADGNDRIIYNSATGNLFFDADGRGGNAQIRFAILDAGLDLNASNFLLI